jgi:GAF domain-containing protein/HAMP domain-containing protein
MNNGSFSPPKFIDTEEKDRAAEVPYQTAIDNSPENRRFGFWEKLSLTRKLLLAFSTLFIFAAVIAVITLLGSNRTQAVYEDTLAQGIEMRRLSNQLAVSLSQARDDEKNFLLRWRIEGYDTAYKNYVTDHKKNVSKMRGILKQLATFGPVAATSFSGITTQEQYEGDIAYLAQNVDAYENNFAILVDQYHNKGFDQETDFESQFRTAAVNMDSYLFFGGLVGGDAIKVTYLRIRLSEKNYLADASQSYANDIHSLIPVLKDQITLSTQLKPENKTVLLSQVDAYVTAFDALVELDKKIATSNQQLFNAASAVEFMATKIDRLGEILATGSISTARANSSQTLNASIITVGLVLLLTIFISITLSRQITRPIRSLTNTAKQISTGSFNVKASVTSGDEVGLLAQTFNNMTEQLRGAFQNLDHRAHELEQQTAQLELTSQQSKKRAQQLQTIAEIARYISTEKDLNKLLPLITQTVSERFGFYHVGIFLLDDTGTFAVLLASNSPGGQKMLQRHHSLKVGQVGIVGNVTSTGVPRIASDIGEDATFFNNPDLPQTRSELALPLKIEKQVIGALDIQSTEINVFSDEEVDVLTILADQASIAIQNTRLFNEIEKALAESNAIQRQYLRETWKKLPQEEKLGGYRYSVAGAVPLDTETELAIQEHKNDKLEVNVPITLRGETIGILSVQVPKARPVDADQMDLIKAVAERVALSAENARLFDATSRRAESERIISDIASKIGASFRTENILRTTAVELSQLLDDADIIIDLKTNQKENEQAK